MIDVFEHVIRGVCLHRLRELLRGGDAVEYAARKHRGWGPMPEPGTI